ncbi:YhcN/YlaJ family sporulation lipoprotein [Niallia sp. Krafla_26]|uniref:YhcN/YlaJ family sporulation lipoprotein n=1 Tax=Niallia sp. Krafla_26 TaxID=3064703 RepID=UPI003D16879E
MKIYLMLFISLFVLFGCAGKDDQTAQNENNQAINVKNSTIQHVDKKTGQQISKHLTDLATSLPKVNDATSVVLGNYAIVGIDVNADLDRSEVGAIKYSVAESLKKDPHGARAIVVADPDINARLREIAEDIRKGEPIEGIMNELSDVAGRLIPEIPADLEDPKKSEPTEDIKKTLNKSDRQNLDKQQQEQSNHHKQ